MPCQQCGNGKWRWGFGPCQYDSKADCEAAHPGGHHFEDQLAFLDSLEARAESNLNVLHRNAAVSE
jgi:hypothetical protein